MVLSVDDTVNALQNLTEKSLSCQGPANQITIVNIALAVSGFGPIPVVVTRLTDIVSTGATTIQAFSGTKPFTAKADQDSILSAWRNFVTIHQDLQNILIGKSGLVPNLLPFVGPPLASVLRQLESIIDTIAFELIDSCMDTSKELTTLKDSLDTVLIKSIDSWSGTTQV